MKILKNYNKKINGITLISLVITIVILVIIASVTISITLGNNGLFNRVQDAKLQFRQAQYTEEIQLTALEIQMERNVEFDDTPFVLSLEERLGGTESQTASTETTSVFHPKKSWVQSTEVLNEEDEESTLIVDTIEGYELVVSVNNKNYTVNVDSFEKQSDNNKCTIIYDANTSKGGQGTMESSTNIRIGAKVQLKENTFTNTNVVKQFVGWSQNKDAENGDYIDKQTIKTSTMNIENNTIVLYAIWSEKAVNVTFSSNYEGKGNLVDRAEEISQTQYGTLTLPSNTYFDVPDGYEFEGWSLNQNGQDNGQNTVKAVGEEIQITGNTTIYAQWTQIYNITYVLNGGSVSTANPTSYTKNTESFTLNNPTKDKYTFVGWTRTDGGATGQESTTPQATVTITKGIIR